LEICIREKPIIFPSSMVRAILAGRKTQTRCPIEPQPVLKVPDEKLWWWHDRPGHAYSWWGDKPKSPAYMVELGPYKIGMRLWVRETFLRECNAYANIDGESEVHWGQKGCRIEHVADGAEPHYLRPDEMYGPYMAKCPSIHMPRWASRITLEITGVKVERLKDITEGDAKAEGVTPEPSIASDRYWPTHRDAFQELWTSLYAKKYPWESNPWIWKISFKRVAK
jgi:hypothetical protein